MLSAGSSLLWNPTIIIIQFKLFAIVIKKRIPEREIFFLVSGGLKLSGRKIKKSLPAPTQLLFYKPFLYNEFK